jgi:hypothetical protein
LFEYSEAYHCFKLSKFSEFADPSDSKRNWESMRETEADLREQIAVERGRRIELAQAKTTKRGLEGMGRTGGRR